MNGYSSQLVHSQGNWKNHKYSGKVNKGGKTYYLYGSEGLMNRSTAARMNLKKGRMSTKKKEEDKDDDKNKKKTLPLASNEKPAKEEKAKKEKKEKAAKGSSGSKEKASKGSGSKGSSKPEKEKNILRDNKTHKVNYFNSDKVKEEDLKKKMEEYDKKRKARELEARLRKKR